MTKLLTTPEQKPALAVTAPPPPDAEAAPPATKPATVRTRARRRPVEHAPATQFFGPGGPAAHPSLRA